MAAKSEISRIHECNIDNPFCSKCGSPAAHCYFPTDVMDAKCYFSTDTRGPCESGKMLIDLSEAVFSFSSQTQMKLKCPNGHVWEREIPQKQWKSGL